MRPRTTLVLAVLALAAGGAWYFGLQRVPGTGERRDRAGRLVPSFEPGDVQRIEIDRPAGPVAIARSGAGWVIESPSRDKAELAPVENLLESIRDARPSARVPLADVRGGEAATGLGASAVRVRLAGKIARHTLVVGADPAPGDRRYVRVDDGPDLALVDRPLVDATLKPLDDFREHDVVSIPPVDVERCSIAAAGKPPLAFERREGGRWWITAPLQDAADDALVSGIVGRLAGLRADRFVEPRPGARDMGLDPPATVIRLQPAGTGAPVTVELGHVDAETGEVYGRVQDRPLPFLVSMSGLGADLARDPLSFRSRALLDIPAWEVSEITLERGGATVRLVKQKDAKGEDAWSAGSPAGFRLDAGKVRDAVSGFAHLEGIRIADGVSAASAGLAPPVARLVVSGADPRQVPRTTVEIGGPAPGGGVFARASGRATIVVLPDAPAALIDPARVAR